MIYKPLVQVAGEINTNNYKTKQHKEHISHIVYVHVRIFSIRS